MDLILEEYHRQKIIDNKDSGLLTVESMSPSLALRLGHLLCINHSLSKTPDSHPTPPPFTEELHNYAFAE